jgi:hypothetical protein
MRWRRLRCVQFFRWRQHNWSMRRCTRHAGAAVVMSMAPQFFQEQKELFGEHDGTSLRLPSLTFNHLPRIVINLSMRERIFPAWTLGYSTQDGLSLG